MQSSNRRMDTTLWRLRLAELGQAAAVADGEAQAYVLRAAFSCLALMPPGLIADGARLPTRHRFEQLMIAKAWDSAALALALGGALRAEDRYLHEGDRAGIPAGPWLH
jgi:hypothetical protein